MLRVLHLGLGAFHRAHQAVFLQRLMDAGDDGWQIAAGNLRPESPDSAALLRAQGHCYTVESVTPDGARAYQRIDVIREAVPYTNDLTRLIALACDPATRIVSFTVTEAGYAQEGAAPDGGHTLYGALIALLGARRASGAGALTLLSCDNLRHNGDRMRAGLLAAIEGRSDHAMLDWVRANTNCPNAMVDRITPRPPAELAARVKAATGHDDHAAVMAEDYLQWVIEDHFCNGRPAWERAGVQMVDSVLPYEEAKIRLLNATHSCIAWAGTLAGHRFIHEGTRDARIRRLAHDYISDDAIPCLRPSPIDLEAYRDSVLARFSNAALADTNERVVMDSFAKLPGFIVPTIRERLARSESITSVAVLPALLLAFLQRWARDQLPYAYSDQAMDPAQARAMCSAPDPVAAFCGNRALWGALAGSPALEQAVHGAALRVMALTSRDAGST
ncbi:MAG: D-arabinitol 4-dehydrogenase [Pseudomonadota bacterium]